MKTVRILALALAITLVASWTLSALAADTPAAPAAKSADTPKVEAKAKPKSEIKCEVTGKLQEKTATNKKGKEVKVFSVVVATAKDADGKALETLAGKTLPCGPQEGREAGHVLR